MDKRFGVKDLFLFILVGVLILLVFVAMNQYDRQWEELRAIKTILKSQSEDVIKLRQKIERGLVVTGPRTGPTTQLASEFGDPFKYVHEAMAKPDYAQGDWLIDNFGVKVSNLTPFISTDVYATIMQARVQETLTYRDPNTLQYLPLLATGWKIQDNSAAWHAWMEQQKATSRPADQIAADPKAPSPIDITFHLRRGVVYSDGQPFTADDIVFAFEWVMNPKVNAPRDRAYLEKIRSVEKKGDHEVVFHFKEPYFEAFELAGGFAPMPRHFYGKYTPEQYNQHPGLLLGTGPYRLDDPSGWRPGMRLQLVRNERYWGEPGPFDRLVWYEVEQDSVSLTMFKNGEIDVFPAQPEQYNLMLKDKSLVDRTQHFEYLSPVGGYTYIAWNQKKKDKPTMFADKRVRQAMTMLTDRQRLCDEVMLGYATVATGPFSPLGKQVDPSIKPWPYDVKRAKELLKEAGFEDRNGDGVLESPSGEMLKFKLTYSAKNEMSQRISLFLKDTYARAGVALEPDPTDWPIMLKKLETRDFDAITLGWTGGIESDIYQMFHSSQIKDNGDDFMSYVNPELDRLIEEARMTVDEQKRLPLWRQCHKILHEDQPYTFVFDRKSLVFMDQRIKNVGRSRIGLNYSMRYVMPIPWYVPASARKWGK